MEVIRVQGNDLVENCVYNIYENEGNGNVGVCLVESENNINNRNKIKLRKLIGNNQLSLNKSAIYGKIPVDLTRANLTGVNLNDSDLSGAILNGIHLIDAVLTNANLTSAKLNFSDLTRADLTSANLSDSRLIRADLTGANLNDANLSDSRLICADLTGANLNDANLTNASLNGIKSGKIKGKPILPSRYVLINGYIIGPNVDLTGADLTGADLTGADLNRIVSYNIKGNPILPSRYVLINGYIIGPNVHLTGADLTGADLTGADLTNAVLTGADLTGADLTNAVLTRTDLTGADLTNAVLTRTDLTGADLAGATIYRNQLSDEQRRQIRGQPNYIEQQNQNHQYLNISKELSNGNRISIKTGNKLDNSNVTTQHRISFTRLLDFLLQEENQQKIARRIRIGGEEGIDVGGITLIIFQKCYEAFMERYFYPYEEEDNSNYVVLKYLTDEQFEEFKKACAFMILLAKKVKNQLGQPFQILIPINFLLFQVLIFEGNPETFFELGNKNKFFGKRENGSYSNQPKLNNPFNYIAKNRINNNKNNFSIQRIYEGKYNNNQNSTQEFIAKNRINNNEKNFSIQRMYEGKYNNNNPKKFNNFEDSEQQKLMFLMLLKKNHIHKRKQYETMKKFIDEIFKPNKDMFTTHIDYSYEAFVKRLKFKISSESRNRNLESFESLLEIASNPLIKLLLDYIKVSDEYRMVMTAYVCGSYCYTGDIKILIFTNPSKFPFQSHTCFKVLDVFIRPLYPRAFKLLKENNPNNINNNNLQRLQEGHYEEKYPNNSNYSIKKLYNIFLDRSTQIA